MKSLALALFSLTVPTVVMALGPLGGVNTAGLDFGVDTSGQSFLGTKYVSIYALVLSDDTTTSAVPPPTSQFAHFASEGANLFRIPFGWQLALNNRLGGTITSNFFSQYDTLVNAALATGAYAILDLHNYARWNGAIVNNPGGPTIDQFSDFWSQMAAHYASQTNVIFGLMNELHDLGDNTLWPPAVQGAINAIRAAGATSQYTLMPGSSYASAQTLPTEMGPLLLNVTDPAGGTDKLLFDVHKYLDSDNSGTHSNCVTENVDVLTTLSSWLSSSGGRQAILSETGGGRNDSTCFTNLGSELAYVKANTDTIAGFAVWATGAFDETYVLSVSPGTDVSDAELWTEAVQPNLP